MDVLPLPLQTYLQSFDLLTGGVVVIAAVALIAALLRKRHLRRLTQVPLLLVSGFAVQIALDLIWQASVGTPAPYLAAYVTAACLIAALINVLVGLADHARSDTAQRAAPAKRVGGQ